MTFEDDLRTTLQHQAGDLDLHGRGATEVMHLARRRQHRARRATAAAAAGVLTVGTIGVLSARGRSDDGVAVSSWAQDIGLPDVGPLELDWQSVPGGITGGMHGEPIFTEDTAGGIYALSTAPGSQFDPTSGASPPAALYRLGADGAWATVSDGGVPPLTDITADGTVLYALSTSPAGGSAGFDTVLSSSTDGGANWTTASIAPVPPPSTAVLWDAASTLSIESVPGASVAVVTTNFFPSPAVVDQAAAAAGITGDAASSLSTEYADAGLEVVRYDQPSDPASAEKEAAEKEAEGFGTSPSGTVVANELDGGVAIVPTTAPPTTEAPAADPVPSDTAPEIARAKGAATGTVVATIPWAQLGITGPADLGSHSQVLVHRAEGWVPVDSPAIQGLGLSGFRAVGQELVLTGWLDDRMGGSTGSRTFASSDGVTWREVPLADDGRLFGLGNAWIDVPWAGSDQAPIVRSSGDRGTTWQSLDLTSVDGRLADTAVVSVDSGSLGLALVASKGWVDGQVTDSFLVTTRDLVNWTVTPLADVTGIAGGSASVFVGSDRIVVTGIGPVDGSADPNALPPTVTAIGTPVR